MFQLLVLLSSLDDPAIREEIVVSATKTETKLSETASSVVVLLREELAVSAPPTIDDTLRRVPGFTLFRRSGSRYANPTAQGVSLRGVGASGASRAVVLLDGVPLNDPFGGWVYWGRAPLVALERIEVLRGGASDLYGGPALSGAIVLVPEREHAIARGDVWLGSSSSGGASVFARSKSLQLAGERHQTAGYVPVGPDSRGAIDSEVGSRHSLVDLGIFGEADGALWSARLNGYVESRENGTPMQINDTDSRQLVMGADSAGSEVQWSVRVWGQDQDYHQTFSSLSADRSFERLTREQRVDSQAAGARVDRGVIRGRWKTTVGGELRWVDASNRESVFTDSVTRTDTEATQWTGAFFLQSAAALTPTLFTTAGLRADRWSNVDALRRSAPGDVALSDRNETQLSPRLTVLWSALGHFSLAVSVYHSFRAPTLNELYRPFRVGNVLTLSNESLAAETATGVETGIMLRSTPAGALRANVFAIEVADTIANVTLSTEPSLVTRQRQNLGKTSARGVELEWSLRRPGWSTSAGYAWTDSRVRSFAADPELEGKRLPQIPRHQLTADLHIIGRRFTVGWGGRFSSLQFDDDRNVLPLDSFLVMDAYAGARVGGRFEVYASMENLLDETVETGRTPLRTLGPGRELRVGLKF